MDTSFDILQAIGLGLAFGLRPVLAPLIVAICAAAGLGIDLDGTVVEFLGETPAIIALVAFAIVWLVLDATRGTVHQLLALVFAVAFAAAFGAGGFDEHSADWWPGAVAGAVAALLGWAALTPLLAGARQRLAGEKEASVILPFLVEITAVVLAFLSLIFPPLAVVALLAVLVLFARGRKRDQRYAGLRTLSK